MFTISYRGLGGQMVVEPTQIGVRVTFTRTSGVLGFTFDLSEAEFQVCVSQAMDLVWESNEGTDARRAWAALLSAKGAARTERAAFGQAASFVAGRMLSDPVLAAAVTAKLAEVLKKEHFRQADWRRHA